MEKTKNWGSLSIRERTNVAKQRLLHPELTIAELAKELNVHNAVIKKVESSLSFDKEHAVAGLMSSILSKDTELMELAGEVNVKFAQQVASQRTLKAKDVDTIDKISNSAMKRAALMAAANSEGDEGTDINITLTF